eukprot:sb/3467796/
MALLAADYCRQVIDLLAEYDEEAAESANSTMLQVGAVALGALVGAVFGGRMGAVAGSALAVADRMTKSPLLFSYFRSSCSWRVRIALELKQIKYDQKAVHLLNNGGEQHSDEYKSLNGMEQVPTLLIDGLSLTQSIPIIEYLEETRPQPNPLLPGDPALRARVRQISEIINSGIQPVQNLSVLQAVGAERKIKWGHDAINKGLLAVEEILKETSGKYCVGDTVTIADLCLIPQVYNATRFKVDMSVMPTITRVVGALEGLPEFRAAHYSRQPDTPDELRDTSS